MKKKSLGLSIVTTVGILAVITLPVAAVSADEPEPARVEEPTEVGEEAPETAVGSEARATDGAEPALGHGTQPTTAVTVSSGKVKKPRSLADLAGGLDLSSPQDDGNSTIVITNENLKTMGKGAVVSEGSNIGGSSSNADWFVPPSARGATPGDDEIKAARREVEKLEGQVEAINQAVTENQTANMYTGGGPQYRAPGVTDPLRDQQQNITKQLADARAKLSSMEKAAARAGKPGARPRSAPPRPSPANDGG